MKAFNVDPQQLLVLARDLEEQSHQPAVDRPVLPGGPVADFCAALAAARDNVLARDTTLRQDLAALAETALATRHAALTADGATAARLGAVLC